MRRISIRGLMAFFVVRRISIRGLMAVVAVFAVGLAILENAAELSLIMVLFVALAALGTKWPYHPGSQDVEDQCVR